MDPALASLCIIFPVRASLIGTILVAGIGRGSVGKPGNLCGYADARGQGIEDLVADAGGAADAVEEFGLEEAGNAEGWGGERYAEGGVGADEQVLMGLLATLFQG